MSLADVRRIDSDTIAPEIRRPYFQASAMALAGNAILLAAKAVVAHLSGSSAIYADAANSAADVAYSLLMVLGLWLALRPPDANHPHGHRRIEPLVSLFIAAMILLAGVGALRHAHSTWRAGPQPITSPLALAMPVITAAVKLAMYATARTLGHRAHSPAILASARDNLSDVLTSAAALVGVASSRWFLPAADPLAALAVSAWILWAAWGVLREGVRHLIGGAGNGEIAAHVLAAAQSVPGVLDVHQVIVEHVGPQVRADIHINMPGDTPLREVHSVSDAVRHAVEALQEVEHAFVHVEPPEHTSSRPASDASSQEKS